MNRSSNPKVIGPFGNGNDRLLVMMNIDRGLKGDLLGKLITNLKMGIDVIPSQITFAVVLTLVLSDDTLCTMIN